MCIYTHICIHLNIHMIKSYYVHPSGVGVVRQQLRPGRREGGTRERRGGDRGLGRAIPRHVEMNYIDYTVIIYIYIYIYNYIEREI